MTPPFFRMLILLILWKMIPSRAEQRWGILSAYPNPIPEIGLRTLMPPWRTSDSTSVDLILPEGLQSWISSAFSLFKDWVGVGCFFACCIGGCVLCLWLICRLQAQASRDKVVMLQALAALEKGDSPQVWLSVLKSQ